MSNQVWLISLSISLVMMKGLKDDGQFLPDLNNDKTGEQIMLEQKVFRANETFIRVHQDIINWYLSPENSRQYPDCFAKNKNGFRMRCKNYIYDENKGILYKRVKCSDGIGKCLNHLIFN